MNDSKGNFIAYGQALVIVGLGEDQEHNDFDHDNKECILARCGHVQLKLLLVNEAHGPNNNNLCCIRKA